MPDQAQRPFRFGVLAENARSRITLIETARRAEDAGYAIFLLRDHFIEEPFGHQLAPFPALTTVATVTESVRVGTLVCCNDYRHPVMLAKEASTLDVLSGGRFELGLGAGFSQAEYDQAGMVFDPPGTRVDRLEEAIRVIKGLFASQPCTFNGKHYTVSGLDSFPKPVQRPHPPVLLAGAGRRMLGIAAREADIVGIQTVSTRGGSVSAAARPRLAEMVTEQIAWIREAAGDRFHRLELSTTATVVVTEDRHGAAGQLARDRGWQSVSPDHVLEMPAVFIGSVSQIVDTMLARREQYGLTYYVFSDADIDTAAPVVAQLVCI